MLDPTTEDGGTSDSDQTMETTDTAGDTGEQTSGYTVDTGAVSADGDDAGDSSADEGNTGPVGYSALAGDTSDQTGNPDTSGVLDAYGSMIGGFGGEDAGDGASEESLAGATTDYSGYEPSPYQIRHTNSAAEVAMFAALDTVGAAGDGLASLVAHGVGGIDGLLGYNQAAANWHDLGNKELENARASARNAMRDVSVMLGDREVRPYPDGHDQCPVPHGS